MILFLIAHALKKNISIWDNYTILLLQKLWIQKTSLIDALEKIQRKKEAKNKKHKRFNSGHKWIWKWLEGRIEKLKTLA